MLIFKPLGFIPSDITLAPNSVNNLGAALYPAPFAQSITILIPFKLKFEGKFFLSILIYFSFAFSILFTLPRILGFDNCFNVCESISFSIFFSILSESFNPSGPNNFKPLS